MKKKPARKPGSVPERLHIDPKRPSKGSDPLFGKHGRPQAPRDEKHRQERGRRPKSK